MKIINTIGNIRQITIGILKELMLRREIKMSLLEVDGYFYMESMIERSVISLVNYKGSKGGQGFEAGNIVQP